MEAADWWELVSYAGRGGARCCRPSPQESGVREQVRHYLDHLATERGLASNSVSAYRRDLRRYPEHLTATGVRTLADVGEREIAEFLDLLRTGNGRHPPLAAASAARAVVTVRGLHRYAHRQGLVEEDVSRPIRPPSARRERGRR